MEDKLKTVIVDDESLARNLIKSFMKDLEDVELIGECENGFEGVKMINELKPDLVILDIQMPKITGLEMLELLDHKPEVIFSTAYDQYAIKAFEHNAVDYLLKPFSKERFNEAIKKVAERISKGDSTSESTNRLSEEMGGSFLERIVVKDRSKINIIPVNQIIYIEAMDDYVMIYTPGGRFIKQKRMKNLEKALNPSEFVRIHRSYIVKVNEIKELQQYEKESYIVILNNKTKLKVSKSGYKKLKEILNF
jgi:two-component system, LytTR family, response regulator